MPFSLKELHSYVCEAVSDMDDTWHVLGDWSIWGCVTYYMSYFYCVKLFKQYLT